MNMIEERERLKNLVGEQFIDKATQMKYVVTEVYHNIYRDVCMKLVGEDGKTHELIEGSEEYYIRFRRL